MPHCVPVSKHSVQLSPGVGDTLQPLLSLFQSHLYIGTRQSQWCESHRKLLMVTRIKRPCHQNYFLSEFNNKHVAKTDYEWRAPSRKSRQLINRLYLLTVKIKLLLIVKKDLTCSRTQRKKSTFKWNFNSNNLKSILFTKYFIYSEVSLFNQKLESLGINHKQWQLYK